MFNGVHAAGFAVLRRVGVLGLACLAFATAAEASSMGVGKRVAQPIGQYEFCVKKPGECRQKSVDKGALKLTDKVWRQILGVNAAVNKSVRSVNDSDASGASEVWSYPNGQGDCEDFVLEKRRALGRRGISLSNLLITVVQRPNGEGHAVLTVRTDKGDYVLDNLTNSVRLWNQTNYRYLKRQSSTNSGSWVSIKRGSGAVAKATR